MEKRRDLKINIKWNNKQYWRLPLHGGCSWRRHGDLLVQAFPTEILGPTNSIFYCKSFYKLYFMTFEVWFILAFEVFSRNGVLDAVVYWRIHFLVLNEKADITGIWHVLLMLISVTKYDFIYSCFYVNATIGFTKTLNWEWIEITLIIMNLSLKLLYNVTG